MLADAGLRPSGREGRLRALPGVLGAVGVGARAASARTAPGSMISSSAPTAERSAARRRRWTSSPRTSPCASAVFVEEQGLFAGTDRDECDDARRTRCTSVAVVDGEVVGTVRLYPLDGDGLWKGDRLAVLPDARVHRLGGAARALRRAHRGRAAAARGWSRRCRCRTCASSSGSAGRATATPALYRGVMHQPMAIPLRPGERRGGEVPGERGRRRRRRGCSTRVASNAPQRRAGEPAARERRARLAGVLGRAASRKPKLGNVSSQRSSGAPSGRGSASRSSVAPQPAPSIICSSEPAMPGIETSRAAWQRPCSATSTSASPSVLQQLLGSRSCSAVKKSLRRRSCTGRRARTRRAATSPGCAAAARSGARGEAGARGRQRGRVAEREVAADDRDAELSAAQRDAVEHRARRGPGRARRACRRSPSGRPPMARTSETFVTTAAAPAPNGSARRNGGEIASPQSTRKPSPCGDQRARRRRRGPRRAARRARGRACRAGRARLGRARPARPDRPSRPLNQAEAMTPRADVLHARRGREPRAVDVRRRAARPGRAGRRGRLAAAGRRRRGDARRC